MVYALVIENEPNVAQELCQLLGLLDVSARPAYNTQAARFGLAQTTPDLVFLSTTFPDESWGSLLDQLSGEPHFQNVPVVIVASCEDPEMLRTPRVLDVIRRPASLEAIESSLRKAGLF